MFRPLCVYNSERLWNVYIEAIIWFLYTLVIPIALKYQCQNQCCVLKSIKLQNYPHFAALKNVQRSYLERLQAIEESVKAENMDLMNLVNISAYIMCICNLHTDILIQTPTLLMLPNALCLSSRQFRAAGNTKGNVTNSPRRKINKYQYFATASLCFSTLQAFWMMLQWG